MSALSKTVSSRSRSTRLVLLPLAAGFGIASCAHDAASHSTNGDEAGAGSSVVWSPAKVLTSPTGGGAAPVFAVSPSGNLALAWVSAPNGGSDGRLYVRSDAAQPDTSRPVELRDPLGSLSIYGEVPPKVAFAPNGALYAAYIVTKLVPGKRWPQNALRFAVSRDGGAHWDTPTTVTGDSVFGSYDDHALHVAPDGTIYLSWLAMASDDTSHAYFSRSADGGKTWSKPAVIDQDRACPCCRTTMASGPDGALYVAWRKRFAAPGGEERDIVVAKSTDKGVSWNAPVRVHADAWKVNYCPDAGPSVKVGRDGTVHVAWWTGKEGSAGTQYARSGDGGRTFSAPVALGLAQYSRAAHIQVTLGSGIDSSLVVATWDDGTRRVPQVVTRISRDAGRTFGPAITVSDSQHEAGYPVVAVRGDTIVVAWQERTLAAAAAESASLAKKDTLDPATYVNNVGALQVVTRRGVIAGSGTQ
ncbi:MAG TPA: sialidase family protein [Gemmatimonadaceae bacterium]